MTDIAFEVLPVGILTGFLGSGKTTLLRRWLQGSAAGDTAVLINEFGDVGLDHLLVGAIDADTVLLDNGCICCSIRGELKEALTRLLSRRQRGELPAFRRVLKMRAESAMAAGARSTCGATIAASSCARRRTWRSTATRWWR